jgi:hypothetical protein
MRQFRAAWDRFAADEVNLTEFLNESCGGADGAGLLPAAALPPQRRRAR